MRECASVAVEHFVVVLMAVTERSILGAYCPRDPVWPFLFTGIVGTVVLIHSR